MRFQGLAVVLGKMRWPELVAHPRKKDFGLDAYAAPKLTADGIGKGLAASITPTLKKISGDAKTAKENYPDLKRLLFVTSAKVGNADRKRWEQTLQKDPGVDLYILEREEIIAQMLMPENASLCASFLHLNADAGPQVADLISRTRRAASAVVQSWAAKTKGNPLIDLTTVRLAPNGAESDEMLSLEQIDRVLSQSGRIVLEGAAGRGKTTTLIQLAQRADNACTFIVELPAWTSSHRGILEYIAGIPAFQAEGLTAADLARAQQTEPFRFLLNGWNEIAESNSSQADNALRGLEREFPSSGIIVATRTHHLTPPLPGAQRLRLLPLRRVQRTAYLTARLGAEGSVLSTRIESDRALQELTLTPFVLSEVASLFEAGAAIPSTKIDILAEVLRLQEHRDEHRNALQTTPIFGWQTDYLKALAMEMTRRGAVALPEVDARTVVAATARELANSGQIEQTGAQAVLGTLTAHHVLVRVDYPQAAYQFEHQQLQEYFAALDVRARLLDRRDDDNDALERYIVDYVNDPAWAEPLRMIAETLAEQTGHDETDKKNQRTGGKLVTMALAVDPVFAGELAMLCGAAVWSEIRTGVGERFRAIYAIHDGSFRRVAIAAMLATGAADFSDIILPILSGSDQQARLTTYRLWPNMQASSLGPNWRELVRGWSEEAQVEFVSELLHHHTDHEIVAFAADSNCIAVKKAATSALMWSGSEDELTLVLESMDGHTFDIVARADADLMPAAFRTKAVAAMREFIKSSTDHPARLRTALELIKLGETDLDDDVKDAMTPAPSGDMRKLSLHYIQPALEYLRKIDPTWSSEWVANQVAGGLVYEHDYWLQFATTFPESLVEKYLQRLENEDLKNVHIDGMITVIAAGADAARAARVFTKLRELWRKVDAAPGQRHDFEMHVLSQLNAVFRRFPDDSAVAGVLLSVRNGDPLDIKVTADLLSKIARLDEEPLQTADKDLRARLRTYLKSSVGLVLRQDDFNGEGKANLASSIAQVGCPEDMVDLLALIRADIERMRRGRVAYLAGDRGPLGNGGIMSYARWHIAAAVHLDPVGAEQVLVDLLPEQEYATEVAAAMMKDFEPKNERSIGRTFSYDLMWAAREGRTPPSGDTQRRTRFSAALKAELARLRELNQDEKPDRRPKELATALAAIDGRSSAAAVLDVIATPGKWDHYNCLNAAKRLLLAGVVLPSTTVFALVDSFLERTGKWMHDSDRWLLRDLLELCPFVDDPVAGIAKMREVLGERRLWGNEQRDLVTALGESRSDAAIDLLCELASDPQAFEQCEDNFFNAFATLDSSRARELLLGFVDPDIRGISLPRKPHRDDILVARLLELAQRSSETAVRLQELCDRDLPDLTRHLLSEILDWLGTPEALNANLNLIDDSKPSPVPHGIWEQLETAFVEHRPFRRSPNVFTQHARAANELRARLFKMANEDEKRWRSASRLLGQIEEWRLEYGRPTGEPRHPDLPSGRPWPPKGL